MSMNKSHYRECGDCIYRKKINRTQSLSYCDYLCMTGEVRGCPPGRKCIRKISRDALEDELLACGLAADNWALDWRLPMIYWMDRLKARGQKTHRP